MTTRTTSRPFSRTRLQLARSFAALTQAELAEKVSVTQQFIGYLENGRKQPSDLVAAALGDALGVEPEFFLEGSTDDLRIEEWSFRKYQTTPAGTIHRLSAHGVLFGQLVDYLDQVLKLPKDDVPVIESAAGSREQIEEAAEQCRVAWGLGRDLPLKNITRTLERAGVAVTAIPGGGDKVDAFSRSSGTRSVVVLNDDKKFGSRRVFNLAHELGHLVLHVGQETGTHETEDQANVFASAFVLPRAGFVKEFPRPKRERWTTSYWALLFEMKRRWRTSVAAITRRAFDLRLIDALQYQRAYKYLSFKGWLRGEPSNTEPELEQPEMVPRAFGILEARLSVRARDVAKALNWKPATLEKIAGVSVPTESGPDDVVSLVARRASTRRL